MHSESVQEPQAILQVWGLAEPSRRGPQSRVTLSQVVDAALALADASGMAAVTLAAVARRVGLTTTALYRYVESKDVLDELVVDAALGVPPSLPAGAPRDRALAWVDALWQRYAEHPWVVGLPLVRAPRCPRAYEWLASLTDVLRAMGDPNPLSTAAAVDTLTRGYAQQARVASRAGISDALAGEIRRRHTALAPDGRPQLDPRADLREMVGRLLPPVGDAS